MNATTIPATRIVGDATPANLLLLERIDEIVEQCVHARRPHFAGWQLQAVLAGTGVRRRNGVTVALRAMPLDGLTVADVSPFPWQHLAAVAAHIRAQVWEVTAVVPDVATAAPVIDQAPTDIAGWSDRLSA